jgi:hypothetical protein
LLNPERSQLALRHGRSGSSVETRAFLDDRALTASDALGSGGIGLLDLGSGTQLALGNLGFLGDFCAGVAFLCGL